jgi:NAD(P)-dependent dehydrogenase (short-subunit alcohol dehydrogenase family)
MAERMSADLDGRVAIVTGGARGIGLGVCECLVEAGAAVVVADIDEDRAQESAAQLDGEAIAVAHDVRRADSSDELVRRTLDQFGRIDVLVNNAGVGPRPAPVQDTTEEEYDRVMDVNVRGVFLTTRAVVPVMIRQESGRIINMSSVVGHTGRAMVLPYSASKHAIVGITQGLAEELAPNITVNSVHPGVVQTDLHSAVVPAFAQMQGKTVEEGWEWFREHIPLGRFQTPRDIGEMVAFLASDRARNITGAAFNVDGGWEMH